jgi:hypothetical protein
MSRSGGNSLQRHVQCEKESSYMQSLTELASIRCLELLETLFNGIERLSRRANGLHQAAAPQSAADRAADSQRAMKATAN